MKLVYLANARIPTPRAYGLQIMKTCEALARAGTEVELVVPHRRASSGENPFSYYGVENRFTITTLRAPDLLSFGSFGFLISTLWFAEKARWLRSFWKADAVYSRDALVLVQYLLLGRPLFFEAHAKPSFVSRIVARRAIYVVVISNGLREAYENVGVSPEKIIVAADAVDEHLFDDVPAREAARAELGLPADATIALYAGHLYARKGADTLAAAARELPDTRSLFIGGAGPELAAFKAKWGSLPNVTIVGHVAHEKVPLYLRAADALVLPNSGKDEDSARFTSPMKLFEYLASGTPIVASDVPSLREILSNETAVLITPDDSHALAEGLTKTLQDRKAATARAKRALVLAQQHTWDKRATAILAHCRGR